jgi:hypothetical protein
LFGHREIVGTLDVLGVLPQVIGGVAIDPDGIPVAEVEGRMSGTGRWAARPRRIARGAVPQ